MNITNLQLNFFRNYFKENVDLSPKVNVFSGNNAQGKTNLLEAVYFMSLGKSMRTPRDKELIMWDKPRGRVKAEVVRNSGKKSVEIVIDREVNKRIAINAMPISKVGELMGVITTVLFSPDEIAIIKNTPKDRRRFIDIALCQLSKSYFYALSDYNKVLVSRNKLLKKNASKNALEVWDMQLVSLGSRIAASRRGFVKRIEILTAKNHAYITDNKEKISIEYEGIKGETKEEIAQNFLKLLEKSNEIDYKHGYTHVGIQTDDLNVMIDGVDVRKYGSQGQQRSASLSLKLAETDLYYQEQGEYPILLLDDVFSELDINRCKRLAERMQNLQTIITCTHLDDEIRSSLGFYKEFKVSQGKIM